MFFSAISLNISKESLPNETSLPQSVKNNRPQNKGSPKDKEKSGTTGQHDDFGDIVDYIMLDTSGREKFRTDIGRIHPIVEIDDEVNVKYPTLGELKQLKLE